MTDWYPDEEGCILEGFSIAICKALTSITALSGVKLDTTSVSGVISINQGTYQASVGIAMKAGVTGDMIPVMFLGIAKLLAGGTILVGNPVVSDTTAGYVLSLPSYTTAGVTLHGVNGTGTVEILGKALQAAATGDEILVLVKWL